ncbi:MAG: hypothetical protein Edafosvirus9_10 [Edafosvirus sp.]|uniref:Exonuclease domain-containing protein n=1 Tax=Edafosvirus sp. TaxID=2487765 RepID=A0A3G4ZTR9_9VIRU|nr:MAG: hypothetical protein Edafosvirus9_10 [Edafosvirus sp.]
MVEHKLINDIEHKYCGICELWKELNKFGPHKGKWDGKNTNCVLCVLSRKKNCEFEDCDSYAAYNYKFCISHGGGKRCLLCPAPVRLGFEYCTEHNQAKCIILNCTKKTYGGNELCRSHDPKTICIFEGCTAQQARGYNMFCRNHGVKKYCIVKDCDRIQTRGVGMCEHHYCEGNIERIAAVLLNTSKKQDINRLTRNKEGKRITIKRITARNNDLIKKDIVDLYNKSDKCHWCDSVLILSTGGEYNLDKISIDRVDNDIGHTKNNIVLSCLFCNSAKNACKENLWLEVLDVLKGKNNNIDFTKYELKEYVSSLYNKYPKISCEWFIKKLKDNDWKCEITGLPLYPSTEKIFPWHISIDRININKSHTEQNCQIVARFVNLGKNRIANDKFKEYFKNKFPNIKIDKVIYPDNFQLKIRYGINDLINYLFFDFRTYGNNQDIIQFSYMIYNDKLRLIKSLNRYIKTKEIIKIDNVYGLSIQKLVECGDSFNDVFNEFIEDTKTVKYFICHSDIGISIIKKNLINNFINIDPFFGKIIENTMKLGKDMYKTNKLSTLYFKLFHKLFDNDHDALSTTKACYECYTKIKNKNCLDDKDKIINSYVENVCNVNDNSILLNNRYNLIYNNI